MKNDSIQSKNISLLRFPMITLIVCIHARMAGNEISLVHGNINNLLITEYVLGDIIATIAVPLYFIISGYLFFYQTNFNKDTYLRKIKKRSKTLLIPYFIWNIIAYLIYLINHQFDVYTFIMSFLVVHPDGRTGSSPMDGPLWFIRNLFIIMLISPIIYTLIKRMKTWWLIPFLLLWISGFSIFNNGIMIAFIFFSLGASLSICKHHLVINRHLAFFSLLFLITITLRYCLHYDNTTYILSKINILAGILFCISLATYINKHYNIESYTRFLGSISFFIYCLHDLMLPYVKTLWINIYRSTAISFNGWIYIAVIVTDICLCILIYIIIQKLSPRLTNLLIGGR